MFCNQVTLPDFCDAVRSAHAALSVVYRFTICYEVPDCLAFHPAAIESPPSVAAEVDGGLAPSRTGPSREFIAEKHHLLAA